MFFELALAGVGGHTVREVKDSLTVSEARSWMQYIELRGSLNTGRRVDRAVGELHYTLLRFMGSKDVKREDLLPYEYPPDTPDTEAPEFNPEQVRLAFSARARKDGRTTGTRMRRAPAHTK